MWKKSSSDVNAMHFNLTLEIHNILLQVLFDFVLYI